MYIVIAGGGKIGSYLASTCIDNGNEVAIIEKDDSLCQLISEMYNSRFLVICGDCCESRILVDAGVENADVFVASTGQDETNLVCCELADSLFDVPRVVARVNSPRNLRIFKEVGIECVSSTNLIGSIILEEALYGSVSITSSLTHGDVILSEYSIPHKKRNEEGAGILLSDIELPQGCRIVAIEKDGEPDVPDEDSDVMMYPGDQVIVVSDREKIPELRLVFSHL
jgi:trk system potassium uptake protein